MDIVVSFILEHALELVKEKVRDYWSRRNSRSMRDSEASQEGSPVLDPWLMELLERTEDDADDLLEEPERKRRRLDLAGHIFNSPLNLSTTSEMLQGNSQRGAGGHNPQVQGRISVGTGANINLGTQVFYKGLNDPEALLRSIKSQRINELLMEISERIGRWKNSSLKKLNAEFLYLQLFLKALDPFKDDPSAFDLLHKHLLETTATSIVDALLSHLAKSLPASLSAKAVALIKALEGKHVDTFITALRAVAEESGLLLKDLDKELERTLLHSYCKDLTSQVSFEVDPVSLLPKVVSLLYLQLCGKALQVPVTAISAAVSHLKDEDKLGDSAHKVLVDYHTATVILSALQSAATEDEEDCTSDRILSKREFLEGLMPELKALVLNNNQA